MSADKKEYDFFSGWETPEASPPSAPVPSPTVPASSSPVFLGGNEEEDGWVTVDSYSAEVSQHTRSPEVDVPRAPELAFASQQTVEMEAGAYVPPQPSARYPQAEANWRRYQTRTAERGQKRIAAIARMKAVARQEEEAALAELLGLQRGFAEETGRRMGSEGQSR